MDLKGKKCVVITENLYQELEVWYPYYRLVEAGVAVYLVGPEARGQSDAGRRLHTIL